MKLHVSDRAQAAVEAIRLGLETAALRGLVGRPTQMVRSPYRSDRSLPIQLATDHPRRR